MDLDLEYMIFFFSSIITILVLTRNSRVIDDIEFLGIEPQINIEILNTTLAGLAQIEI